MWQKNLIFILWFGIALNNRLNNKYITFHLKLYGGLYYFGALPAGNSGLHF